VQISTSDVQPGGHDLAVVGIDRHGRSEQLVPALHLTFR
jgi:hypothetical protein